MFTPHAAFSGFSVSNLDQAKTFYGTTLGLTIDQDPMGFKLQLPGGASVFVYEKANHQPATFTVLNFVVENIDQALQELQAQGITFEQYHNENMPQDEQGILRGLSAGMGPDIAWFEDPFGNVCSILQEK